MPSFLSVQEVASALDVTEMTIRKWIKSGLLRAVKIGPRQFRVRREDFEAFISTPAVAA